MSSDLKSNPATITYVRLADVRPRGGLMERWEAQRNGGARWVIEFIAEAMSTFFYTFAGGGSTAAYLLGNIIGVSNVGSLFGVGFAYAIGIVMALVICLPTSGGHANPAFTIYAMIRGHCTPFKGLRLIVAQIVGAYIACLLIYAQYRTLFEEAIAILQKAGSYDEVMFGPEGPAGILGLYAAPGASLGNIFLNEFVCDFVLAVVVFGVIEPTNSLSPPVVAPWIIAFTYSVVIWGYSPVGLAANSARDIGGRMAVLTIWGLQASGGKYAAIAALTNIPATILAGLFYEFIFNDGRRVITPAYHELAETTKAYEAGVRGKEVNMPIDAESYPSLPQ